MTDVLASIVSDEPNWKLLPPLPLRVRELLQRSLAKNPRERLRDAGEARAQLELAQAEGTRVVEVAAAHDTPERRNGLPLTLLVSGIALAAGYGLRLATESATDVAGEPVAQQPLAVVLAETEEAIGDLELSPDGTRIAWTQPSGVYIRPLASFDVIKVDLNETQVEGEQPYCLAWSPDGTQIAFTTERGLWRLDANGKHLTLVTRDRLSPDTHAQLGWTDGGQLVYSDGASGELFGRSFLVDQTTPLVSADREKTLHFDGVHVLPDDSLLAVRHRVDIGMPDTLSLWRDNELRDVLQLPGWNIAGPVYAQGTLVIERKDTTPSSLWFVALDLERGEVLGDPQLAVDAGTNATLAGDTFAYVVPQGATGFQPAWIDLEGTLDPLPYVEPGEMQIATLSHDRERVLTFDAITGGAVWAHDAEAAERSRAGKLEQSTIAASSLPDGRLLSFEVMGGTSTATYAVAFSGASEFVCDGFMMSVSRDGTLGLAMRTDEDSGAVFAELIDLTGATPPVDLGLALEPGTGNYPGLTYGDISPDKRFALIRVIHQGRSQLVITRTQADSAVLPIVTDSGVSAWFNEAGDTIYYWTASDRGTSPVASAKVLWQVAWQPEREPKLGKPQRLFELPQPALVTGFDPARGRFLASSRKVSGKQRILAQTGWVKTEL